MKNKVIIVTGGSGLLGSEKILHLKKKSVIAINFDIDRETDLSTRYVNCDLTDTNSIDKALSIVLDKFGEIHGLVNNAYPRTDDWGNRFEDITHESWKKNVDMQMSSVFYITQKVCKAMLNQQTKGSIVNIASIYGIVGNDFMVYEGTDMISPAAYSFIKGGVINFTRYLASYYGRLGIRVNTVSPGGIFNYQNKVFVKNYEKKVPLGRMGKPDDIAPVVSFLLSSDSKYISGQNIAVDGGWTAI